MSNVFKGGVPYAVDVNRLKESFPVTDLVEGRVIQHDEFETLIGEKKGSQRYYGVVNAWIKHVRNETGIYMIWEPSQGVKILPPDGVLSHGDKRTRQKIGQVVRATRIYAYVDRKRLDPVGQQRLDHQTRVATTIQTSLAQAKKELAIDLAPVKSLPKPKLIRDSA